MQNIFLFPVGQDVINYRTSILKGVSKKKIKDELAKTEFLKISLINLNRLDEIKGDIKLWGTKKRINVKENDLCFFIYRGIAVGVFVVLDVLDTTNSDFSKNIWAQRKKSNENEEWSHIIIFKKSKNISVHNFFQIIGYNEGFTLRSNQKIDENRISEILDTLAMRSVFDTEFMKELSEDELVIPIKERYIEER